MAPERVIEYVITHELAHTKEMNHSKQFWQVVTEHCPDWRECRRWLKQNETQLAMTLEMQPSRRE